MMMGAIHVLLNQPSNVRRGLLKAALNCAEFMKNHENILSFEEDKEYYRQKVNAGIKRIKVLHTKFLNSLPQLDSEFIEAAKPKAQEKKPEQRQEIARQKKQKPAEAQTRQDLEREIRKLREKISRLNIRKI